VSDYARDVREILSDNGCWFVRHGRGDHDIWESPISGNRFPVDHAIKSRHTANGILKQAGIEKSF
jgi:predicted RNA binding protein YcfA (HicA-like mRNA interferase family)